MSDATEDMAAGLLDQLEAMAESIRAQGGRPSLIVFGAAWWDAYVREVGIRRVSRRRGKRMVFRDRKVRQPASGPVVQPWGHHG